MVLQWLKQNQPYHKEDAIQFEVDILSQSAVDLSLKIDLSEIIKVDIKDEGVYLKTCAEPDLAGILIPNKLLEVCIHSPDRPASNEQM